MKLTVNGRYLTQRTTGVQRFAHEVMRALDGLLSEGHSAVSGLTVELLVPANAAASARFEAIQVRHGGALSGHAWEQLQLPYLARGSSLLSLCNTGPLLKRDHVVVIHDAAVYSVPEAYALAFKAWYRILLPALVRRARQVATVSEFSRSELVKHCGAISDRVAVVSEGCQHVLRTDADASVLDDHGLRRPYLLAVSSLNPSKNFSGLVRALAHLDSKDFDIVIAGGSNNAIFESSGAPSSDRIKLVGYVTDEQLKALYMNAAAFVHPSIYEGFGLTPLEAMACGAAVVVSDIPPLREVCGSAAVYFDPSEPRSIASAITSVMSDEALRSRLRRAGRERASSFDWRQTALDLVSQVRRAPG